MRGWKTVEDQGVPWMRTRVSRFVGDGSVVWRVGGVRSAYLIVQPAWWKVEGRLLLGAALGRDMFVFIRFDIGWALRIGEWLMVLYVIRCGG
jgi:hypothetical protein